MNDIVRGLMYSQDAVLRDAFVAGELLSGPPCLIDWNLLKLAGRVVGPIGSGKTVFLRSLVRQLCYRQSPQFREYCRRKGYEHEPISIVYITFVRGRDDRELNYMAECARIGGMRFRSFDPKPGRRSHIYNPLLQSFLDRMGRSDIAEHQTQAGDMLGDEEHGSKYHGTKDLRMATLSLLAHGRFNSYWDQHRYLADRTHDADMGLTPNDRRSGDQVVDHFQILSTVPPFNEHKRKNGPSEKALRSHINFADAFIEPNLFYFNFDWLGGKRKHTLAKHALFDAQAAAKVLETPERRCRVFFIVDEAQELVASQAVVGVFDQIRHRDISLILAHQYDAQMKRRGPDYSAGLDTNVSWKIDYSLPTPEAMERAQKYAPDDLRPALGYTVEPGLFFDRDEAGALSLARAMALGHEVKATEKWEPRYTKNMIIALNRTGRVGWLRARYDSGATRLNGIEPFIWRHTMSQQEWDAYATEPELAYSPPVDETVEVPLEIEFEEPEPAARQAELRAIPAARREAVDRAITEKLNRLGGEL